MISYHRTVSSVPGYRIRVLSYQYQRATVLIITPDSMIAPRQYQWAMVLRKERLGTYREVGDRVEA
eukprot:1241267-Rhodomonas_salina.1